MKKFFAIAIALAVILSLSYTFLMADEPREKPGEAREPEHMMEHRGHEGDMDSPRRAEHEEEMPEMCEMHEMMLHNIMEMLEHQMNEIRALREEIAELRGILIGQGSMMRWRDQRGDLVPRHERWEQERRDPGIEREIRDAETEVERHPEDIELHMRLAHLYQEVDMAEAAIEQYKAVLEINPDLDEPYHALRELGYKFPEMGREKEEPLKVSMGAVVSANEKEIKLKTLEGDIVAFKVPSRQKDDGSWVLNEDLSELAKSQEPGIKLKILWREAEGQRFIRRIEKMENEDD